MNPFARLVAIIWFTLLGAFAPLARGQEPAPAAPSIEVTAPEAPAAADQDVVPSVAEPDEAEAHHVLGLELLKAGEYMAALEELREAVRVDPGRLAAHVDLGKAFYGLGDLDNAIEAYRAAVRLDPEFVPAHLHLAVALMLKRDWAAATEALQTVLTHQPDVPEAHYNLGVVRYGMGDRAGAMAAYREVLKLKPDQADAHYNLGLLLKLAGLDQEAAEEFYVAALAGLPRAQYFLGSAHASGRGVERDLAVAVQWWFRAADQHEPQAREALAQLRQTAFTNTKRTEERKAIVEAFGAYREQMRQQYPDLAAVNGETLGGAALDAARIEEGVALLIREADALSEAAEQQLESLYQDGLAGRVSPHDPRLLAALVRLADDGMPRARLVLARWYANGVGVPRDATKAKSLLKGHPSEEAKRLLKELTEAEPTTKSRGKLKSATTRRPSTVHPR